METITREDLANWLSQQKGTTFVTITATTEVKTTKGGPIGVTKTSRVNGVIGFNYGNAVTKATGEEYVPQPRKWGGRVGKSPVIVHGDKTYLEVKVEKSLGHSYSIDEALVLPYLRPNTGSPVILRDYNMENISEIVINGKHLEVV